MRVTKNYYIKDKIKFDRITRVLGYLEPRELVEWKLKLGVEAEAQSKKAIEVGSQVHKYCEQYIKRGIKNLPPSEPQEVKNCFKAFKDWVDVYKPSVIDTEFTLFDTCNRVAGTCDLKVMLEGKIVYIDIKTSSKIYKKHWVQVSKYLEMDCIERHKGEATQNFRPAILRLDKNLGIYEYKEYEGNFFFYIDRFEDHLNLFRYYKGVNK